MTLSNQKNRFNNRIFIRFQQSKTTNKYDRNNGFYNNNDYSDEEKEDEENSSSSYEDDNKKLNDLWETNSDNIFTLKKVKQIYKFFFGELYFNGLKMTFEV